VLKVFLLRLGVGGGRIFLKGKWVFSIKDFFLSGVGCFLHDGRNARTGSGVGGGIKKFSAVKISVQGSGTCNSDGICSAVKFFCV
jgi:hypothetical protein